MSFRLTPQGQMYTRIPLIMEMLHIFPHVVNMCTTGQLPVLPCIEKLDNAALRCLYSVLTIYLWPWGLPCQLL